MSNNLDITLPSDSIHKPKSDNPSPSEGLKAISFKGVPIAIEWHSDGSVTLCKEVVEAIKGGDLSFLHKPEEDGTIVGKLNGHLS